MGHSSSTRCARRPCTLAPSLSTPAPASLALAFLASSCPPSAPSPPLPSQVLGDDELRAQYYRECTSMAERIGSMRSLLRSELEAAGSTHDWSHVTSQIGMFAFTGMDAAMCDRLTDEHAIYLTRDGRVSVAGINSRNVEYVAKAIHAVTDGKPIGQ